MDSEETAGAKGLRSEKDPVYNSRVHRRARREGQLLLPRKALWAWRGVWRPLDGRGKVKAT